MGRWRRADEIQQIVEQYRASGLTQAEYCRRNGVGLNTLGRYLRRNQTPNQQLVRVKLAPTTEAGAGFVLTLGNGRRIASGWDFREAELTRLIRVAESA